MRRLFPIAVVAFALACKPSTAVFTDSGTPVTCSTDANCADAGGNCDEGVCTLCTIDSPCPTNEICKAGTCVPSSGGSGSSSSGGSQSSSSGSSGIAPGQCTTSCNCLADGGSAILGPACISGTCGPQPKLSDGGLTCARTNDCPCGDFCSAGTCQPQCTTNATCPAADPFCYLPQGQCGPCTSSTQCTSGQSCVGGKCSQGAGDGGTCSASHCCSNGDCLPSLPACNTTTGVCGKCSSSLQCSTGYVCNTTSGACTAGDGGTSGCGPNGCSAGLSCVNGVCVAETCNPPCGPPATCGANNNCVCPSNCGGNCATGTTCDTATCQCSTTTTSSGGLGSSGGLSSGSIPSTCSTSPCGSCPSGGTCTCIDGSACSSSDLFCLLNIGICE